MIGVSITNWIEVPATSVDPAERRRMLRKFGLVMAIACGLFGGLAAWRDRSFAPYLLGLGGLFLVLGLAMPRRLDPVERAWMKLAGVMSAVMTRVILTLSFILAITPVGLLRRLFAGDSLGLRADPDATTYWVAVEKDGPASRPDKPY